MNMNWENLLHRLQTYPHEIHKILPPCPIDVITAVEEKLGKMPEELSQMLRQFNGAEMFIDAIPFVTIFGITPNPPLPALTWAPEWYIDKFTPKWRSWNNSQSDWAIAMTNYEGLIILEESGVVKEWDTSQRKWSPRMSMFDEWIEEMLQEGDEYIEG
jgi:hypothetical protein